MVWILRFLNFHFLAFAFLNLPEILKIITRVNSWIFMNSSYIWFWNFRPVSRESRKLANSGEVTSSSTQLYPNFIWKLGRKHKKAANDRLKKEWQVEPPKCLLSGMSGKDAEMYSIGNSIFFSSFWIFNFFKFFDFQIFRILADYLAIQEAEEAEIDAQFEQMRKCSIFWSKFLIDPNLN